MALMKPLSLYLHFPFCVRKCRYCDFLSFPASEAIRQVYVDTLCKEIRLRGRDLAGHQVQTVFLGGGTPSLMTEGQLAALMEALRDSFSISEKAEISMECNPGTVGKRVCRHGCKQETDADKLSAFRRQGINRLSIGLQSADDKELALLGRIHTFEDFMQTWQAAREAGFNNINIDLMSGIPGQTIASLERSLERVLSLRPEHLSVYSLIIEEGTEFYRLYGQEADHDPGHLQAGPAADPPLPDEEEERAMYHLTEKRLAESGYGHYEISNYALPGRECLHNLTYWRRGEYLGLGLGAASLLGERRLRNQTELALYMKDCLAAAEDEPVTLQGQMEETMFLGLRCLDGVCLDDFQKRFGCGMEEIYGDVISRYCSLGMMEKSGGRVRLTERGIDVSNWILADFIL